MHPFIFYVILTILISYTNLICSILALYLSHISSLLFISSQSQLFISLYLSLLVLLSYITHIISVFYILLSFLISLLLATYSYLFIYLSHLPIILTPICSVFYSHFLSQITSIFILSLIVIYFSLWSPFTLLPNHLYFCDFFLVSSQKVSISRLSHTHLILGFNYHIPLLSLFLILIYSIILLSISLIFKYILLQYLYLLGIVSVSELSSHIVFPV